MTEPKRIESFEERQKIKGEQFTLGAEDIYVCGCGSYLWILARSGDCVCGNCHRAQARIIVNELAPVMGRAEGKETEKP